MSDPSSLQSSEKKKKMMTSPFKAGRAMKRRARDKSSTGRHMPLRGAAAKGRDLCVLEPSEKYRSL